jgi:hypothetical protein
MKYLFAGIFYVLGVLIHIMWHLFLFCLYIIWNFNLSWSVYKIKYYIERNPKYYYLFHQNRIKKIESETFLQTLKRWVVDKNYY